MRNLMLLLLVGFCIVSCKRNEEPPIATCNECLNEPIIYSNCKCSCNDCRCHHTISEDVLNKYDSQSNVVLLIVGAKLSATEGTGDYWGAPNWFYTKTEQSLVLDKWRSELIENFNYEVG